jgi:hypothetical protein
MCSVFTQTTTLMLGNSSQVRIGKLLIGGVWMAKRKVDDLVGRWEGVPGLLPGLVCFNV